VIDRRFALVQVHRERHANLDRLAKVDEPLAARVVFGLPAHRRDRQIRGNRLPGCAEQQLALTKRVNRPRIGHQRGARGGSFTCRPRRKTRGTVGGRCREILRCILGPRCLGHEGHAHGIDLPGQRCPGFRDRRYRRVAVADRRPHRVPVRPSGLVFTIGDGCRR
jgi:hypothetical protein